MFFPHEVEEIAAAQADEAPYYPLIDPVTHDVTFQRPHVSGDPVKAPENLDWIWCWLAACAVSALLGVLVSCFLKH